MSLLTEALRTLLAMIVFCYTCGKRVRYPDAWVGENPFRFFCTDHKENGDCAEQVSERDLEKGEGR